jgi:ATP/ADP translocase
VKKEKFTHKNKKSGLQNEKIRRVKILWRKFTRLKAVVWPIHNFELKKFLLMAFMFFCILFNYSMLRSIKDSLVVTPLSAEVIPTHRIMVCFTFCYVVYGSPL